MVLNSMMYGPSARPRANDAVARFEASPVGGASHSPTVSADGDAMPRRIWMLWAAVPSMTGSDAMPISS